MCTRRPHAAPDLGALTMGTMRAAPLPPPRRGAGRLPRVRRRSCAGAAALGAALPQGVGARCRAALRPLPGRAPGPAAARRLRAAPSPPLHARLVRRGDRCLLRRGARPPAAGRRPRRRRRDPARGDRRRSAEPLAVGVDAQPHARRAARRSPAAPARVADCAPQRRGRPRPRRSCSPTDAARCVQAVPWSCGVRLSARANPAACDLVRHAFADVPGNSRLARSWAKCARHWPLGGPDATAGSLPAARHACAAALGRPGPPEPALDPRRGAAPCSPTAQLRVLAGTGFLMAYDDPVGLARELDGLLRIGC